MPDYSSDELAALLDETKWGTPNRDAIDRLALALKSGSLPPQQMYTALHIVSRGGGSRYEEIVSTFLCRPDNYMLTRLALQALCEWMGLADKYRDKIVELISGVRWDSTQEIRQMAMSVGGAYLRDDTDVVRLLLSIAEDETEGLETRDDAVRALARAVNEPVDSVPPEEDLYAFDSRWYQAIIARANSLISTSGE